MLEFREIYKNKKEKYYTIYRKGQQIFKSANKSLFEIAKKQYLEDFLKEK